ncbi:MAG: aminoacetone oxidase family FAD-binding enzyme [Clostridia bacterium]|nr:aminoacetone oxidase family FAD-binding enzyme [Clostridia bacterium]
MQSVLIIGGGASGAAAAIALARLNPQLRITLLEKNERILKKLLTTGNGKCNITNTAVSPAVYESPLAAAVLQAYDYQAVQAFLASLSLPIKADSSGRCYPLSESANNVVNTLLRALDTAGVTVITGQEVKRIQQEGKAFSVQANACFRADAVIFAIGSAASVKGYNGLDLCANLGWRFPRPTPALCPIPSQEPFLKALKGVRAKGTLRLGERCESGEIQFTETAVSGICAFNLSRYVKAGDTLLIDFTPAGWSKAELAQALQIAAASAAENAQLLDFLLLRKLGTVVLKRAGLQPSGSPQALTQTDFEALLQLLSAFPVTVEAPADMRAAQTVCGGADARYIDPATLMAKQYPGLFVCGELLNVHAPCGGFNLHWAWASGLFAAQAANTYLSGEYRD